MHATDFAAHIINWQKRAGRHHLPWQGQNAYRVWLSEIMLQQTQVATVLPYYERFLLRFPDVFSLAAAPEDAVFAEWAGLGYYARARNLHRSAKKIVEHHGGVFPCTAGALVKFPGIGESTAAAIAVFAQGGRAAICDGNVKRIFCRQFAIETPLGLSVTEKRLRAIAESLLPHDDLVAYTQGLMDLGATLCLRNKARCEECPVWASCTARQQNRVAEFPVKKPRAARKIKEVFFIFISDGQQVLLEKRASTGWWGGLFCPPMLDGRIADFLSSINAVLLHTENLPSLKHDFTHFRLHIRPVFCLVQKTMKNTLPDFSWQPLSACFDNNKSIALPAPIAKLMREFSTFVGATTPTPHR